MEINTSLFRDFRVVVQTSKEDGQKSARLAVEATAYNGDTAVTFNYLGSSDPTVYVESDITVDEFTGIITFSTLDADYMIRTLREEDGTWLSRYKTALPIEAITQSLKRDMERDPMDPVVDSDELLYAAVFAGQKVVVGLIYDNEAGKYARIGSQWVLMSDFEPDFDDIIVIPIDPEQADAFVELYDTKTLTIDDVKPYEAPAE